MADQRLRELNPAATVEMSGQELNPETWAIACVLIVTNRKPDERAGTVTVVDARELGTKMRKSLGDKRKELTRDAIDEIARLFRDAVELNGSDARVKVMHNQDFGFARRTVERPKRPTWRVDATTTAALSPELLSAVAPLLGMSWPDEKRARTAVSACGLETRQINAVLKSIAVYDAEANPIRAKKGGGYEADADLRDQENIAATSATKVLDLRIPVRGVGEQTRVVEAAAEADSRARAGTGLLLDSIARVEELKWSLITAAVTGEVDVSTAEGSQVLV